MTRDDMAIQPFHFKLKKVSADEERLIEAIHSYLPATGLHEGLNRGIRESVARHLGGEVSFRLEAVQHEEYSLFLSKLPGRAVMAVIGMQPLSHKAIVDIDAPLAMLSVERLLGGRSETPPEPRPLSDTEQGVLEYLVLQILANVHRLCGKDPRVHFRFERFAFGAHEVREIAAPGDGVAVLVFRITLGRHSGFVRLALPDPFVEEGF